MILTQLSPLTEAEPVGAQLTHEGVTYRVWAPNHPAMQVTVQPSTGSERGISMSRAGEFFFATDENGAPGDRYFFELPDGKRLPDVASRFQPDGVHGPSEVISPDAYSWANVSWRRPALRDLSVYEIHVGTFTPEGTFRGCIEKLDHIAALGVNAIELLPVNEFPGRFNWGYDGVGLFAPSHQYGRPDDLRRLVDTARRRGIAVILDVVYNHVGPEGAYWNRFSERYFHDGNKNTWGTGFNFDQAGGEIVRGYILQNVAYWLDEFRVDGLRVDATHAILDRSERHILADIADLVHSRDGFVIAEDERNPIELLQDSDGTGYHFDAVWSDDFHHSVRVALTGIQEAYFKCYQGSAPELARTLEQGWTFCGQPFALWDGRPRGAPCTHLPPSSFVLCIENHDQVGNRAHGERLNHLVSAEAYRAVSALLCLAAYTPMLFMGQEWASSSPFLFFSDLNDEIGRKIRAGRIAEFEKIGLNQDPQKRETMPDPQSATTFASSKLDWAEITTPAHQGILLLYQTCLRWRRAHLANGGSDRSFWKVIPLREGVAIRFSPPDRAPWLLLVALKGGCEVNFSDELAPPPSESWRVAFHTREARFGDVTGTAFRSEYHRNERLSLLAPVSLILETCHAS